MEARGALSAANELLCYRPVDDVYEEWLDRSADKLGGAVEPFVVDVVDGTVAQELVCRDERSSSLHGCAERAGRRTSWGE